ncbi:MAG: hypothetical protein M3024_10325 [Candidatus Dormibacteraeota bacterium]|nr:hypothetical protein [Candidatus Dormibacteraeota bacterium]
MSEPDLTGLTDPELQLRIGEIRERMRPLEAGLAELRSEREVLLTEVRRRERLALRERRAGLREAMRDGRFPTLAELFAGGAEGSFDDYGYHLKTGGEVRLGYPGARSQSVVFTDGRQAGQAADLARAAELYQAGWDLGSPGRPGVRVHTPGTRQERLVPAAELFVRPRR